MSADKVIQKIVITHSDDDEQDNVEPINAVITNENGSPVATVDELPSPIMPDGRTITDYNGMLSVMLSQEPGHKNITSDYNGLSVMPASLPSDFVIPDGLGDDAQLDQLRVAFKSLLDGLANANFIEFSKG